MSVNATRLNLLSPGAIASWSRWAALLALTAFALLVAGQPAQAQTSVTLVSNTGQTNANFLLAFSEDVALPFTTGSHAHGYTLTSIDIEGSLSAGSSLPTFTATIRKGSGASVGASLGTLSKSAFSSGTNTFSSSAGIELEADTSYFLVLDLSVRGDRSPEFVVTASTAEDSGGAAGWSIGDKLTRRPRAGTTWLLAAGSSLVEMAVKGYENAAPPLVSNTGQTPKATLDEDEDYRFRFTTGANASGYTLSSLDIKFSVTSGTQPSYTVKLQDTSDTDLATLTNPTTLTDGINQFTLATAQTLAANTTYQILYDQSGTSSNVKVSRTQSNDEDSGGAAGWSIRDQGWSRDQHTTGTYSQTGFKAQFSIHGSVNPPPPLVSNIGQDSGGGTGSLDNDHAQAFNTGSHAGGYKLTKVQLRIQPTSAASPTYTVKIHNASGGNPGTVLGTLTNPSSLPVLSALETFDFTASGDGIDLAANTTYFVVWDVSTTNSATGSIETTNLDTEDSGAAAGWSIANGGRFRNHDASTWTNSGNARKIAIHGAANTAPTVANAIPDRPATVGTAFSFQFAANTFNDADGDTLTYTAMAPSWLTFTGSTRTFSGTPTAIGTESVTVTATDGSASVSDTFNIVVAAPQSGTPPTPPPTPTTPPNPGGSPGSGQPRTTQPPPDPPNLARNPV